MRVQKIFLIVILLPLMMVSCASLKKSAMRSVADMLSSTDGANAFVSDNDPQLIAEALPLALKLFEILLGYDPKNANLAVATGQNFVMYSGAFVLMPSEMLDDENWQEADAARRRAKKLFRRGQDYLLQAMELRHKGSMETLEAGDYDGAMKVFDSSDASLLYWIALSWLGMASTDPLDMELATTLDKAILLLYRSLELDETNPGIHDIMIQVQTTLPSTLIVTMRERSPATAAFIDKYYEDAGVNDDPMKRAYFHYYRALSLSDNMDPAPHITMATAVSVKEQNAEDFKNYLKKALAIDPETAPDIRLMIILYQEKAQWLLENIEYFFLVDF